MKIEESQVRRLTISEVPNLDPIRVILEDIGPGQGRINIECYGQSWVHYWGGMGDGSLAGFFCGCDEHYIAGKLSNISADVFDPDSLKDTLKRDLIQERRKGLVSGGFARERFNTIDATDLPESENDLWAMRNTMYELMGDEWWCRLPTKPNPDYLYMTRIIKTVQAALSSVAVS